MNLVENINREIEQHKKSRDRFARNSQLLLKSLKKFAEGDLANVITFDSSAGSPNSEGFCASYHSIKDIAFILFTRVGEKRAGVSMSIGEFLPLEYDDEIIIQFDSPTRITEDDVKPVFDLILTKISKHYMDKKNALVDAYNYLS